MPEAERRLREGDLSVYRDQRNIRKTFLIAHGFEASIGVAAFVSSVQFILDPLIRAETAVGGLGAGFSWAWAVLYLLGGAGIFCGLFRVDDRVEMAGLSCFTAAAIVQSVVLIDMRGSRAIYVALIYFAFISGAGARIYLLLALRRLKPPSSADRR